MNFLTRIFSREAEEVVAPDTVTLAEHAKVVKRLQNQLAETTAEAIDRHTWKERAEQASRDLQCERETVARLYKQIQELKPDAAKYREKCRRDREYHANRRQAREKQAAE